MDICITSFWYFFLNMAYSYFLTQEDSKYSIICTIRITDNPGLKSIIQYYRRKQNLKKDLCLYLSAVFIKRTVSIVDIEATKK